MLFQLLIANLKPIQEYFFNIKYRAFIYKRLPYEVKKQLTEGKNYLFVSEERATKDSYSFAAGVDKMITAILTEKENKIEKIIVITPNKCPSTQWREITMSLLNEAQATRIENTRYQATHFANKIQFIIDYKDSNCINHSIFLENVKRYNVTTFQHKQEGEAHLHYGLYWIVKFIDDDHYYVVISPNSHQIDGILDKTLIPIPSCKTFNIYTKSELENTNIGRYLISRKINF